MTIQVLSFLSVSKQKKPKSFILFLVDLDIDETTALLNTADGKKINPFTRILNW